VRWSAVGCDVVRCSVIRCGECGVMQRGAVHAVRCSASEKCYICNQDIVSCSVVWSGQTLVLVACSSTVTKKQNAAIDDIFGLYGN